jgi:hypothetical protein
LDCVAGSFPLTLNGFEGIRVPLGSLQEVAHFRDPVRRRHL